MLQRRVLDDLLKSSVRRLGSPPRVENKAFDLTPLRRANQRNRYLLELFMYGVRSEFDLSAFLGSELTHISFGAHQIQLHFIDNSGKPCASAFIEGHWELDSYQSADARQEQDAVLFKLLGDRVEAAKAKPPDRVVLYFLSGATLVLIDSSERFESFQLQPAGIVV